MCTRRCSVRDYSLVKVCITKFTSARGDVRYATILTCSGERYETSHSKPKNKETKTPPHVLIPEVASATFPQFDTDPSHPKKQPHSRLVIVKDIFHLVFHSADAVEGVVKPLHKSR